MTKDKSHSYWVKISGFIIVLYGAGISVLQIFSDKRGESSEGFAATFFYSSIVVIISIVMISYWILFPSFNKLVDEHRKKK